MGALNEERIHDQGEDLGLPGLDAEEADQRDTVLAETPSTGPMLPCHSATLWHAWAATCS